MEMVVENLLLHYSENLSLKAAVEGHGDGISIWTTPCK